ncbi:hypothetical protein Tco_1229767 [Tanacetum coccineum]
MDGKSKNALWEFQIKGGDDEVLMDDIPYFDAQEGNNICTFKKGKECFDKHKLKVYGHIIYELNNISLNNDEVKELLNEEVCISEKLDVIWYSIGTNEEYIAINTCEYNNWKRTNGIVSSVYHEMFCKKGSRVAGKTHQMMS